MRRCILLYNAQPRAPVAYGATGAFNVQNIMKMEAKRKMQLEDSTWSRYVVEKLESTNTGRAIGIDLGTTNSCVAYIDTQTRKPKIIPSPTGSWVFPTAVTFDKNHTVRLYGEEARA